MQIRQLAIGLGAFAAGAAAWTWGTKRYGDKVARAVGPALAGRRAALIGDDDTDGDGAGAIPGDSTTSPMAPRPATLAAAPVGMAETEKNLPAGDPNPAAEHVPTDLLADEPVTTATRAPEAFRPDPTAVPTEAEKEALRPATGPAPTLVADRGSGFSEAAGAA